MNSWNWISALTVGGLTLGMCVAAACGGDDSETSSSGAGGSSSNVSSSHASVGPTTSSTATTGATGGSGGAGGVCDTGLSFDGDQPNPVFDGCLTANCCTSLEPCAGDADCSNCLADSTATGCDTNTLYKAFQTCQTDSCPPLACGTMLGYGSPAINACVTTNCCATFNPCEADMACNACLQDPMGAGCDMLKLFTDYQTCKDTSCPTDICGTQIGFYNTYDNMSQDAVIDTNVCATTNCCTDLKTCSDPTMDGYLDMNDPEVDACVKCLQEDPSCAAGAVKDAATAFNACMKAKCP